MSLPCTLKPILYIIWANPLMPIPPIPTKWITSLLPILIKYWNILFEGEKRYGRTIFLEHNKDDKKIKDFLHRNKFDEAKEYAEKIVQMRIKKGYCA